MVVVMRNESFCPGANALIKGFRNGLVWEKESKATRVDGGDMAAIDEREGVYDA